MASKVLDRPLIDVVVLTQAWRAAVMAVFPHATTDPDWSRFYRVRMYVGPTRMTVTAATPWTFGIASLQIEEHLSEELGCFDVLPGDARELARLFKPGKDEGEYAKLQFEVREKELTVTDVGGFFPGKALTLNGTPVDERFPDLAQMLKLIDARGRGYVPPPGYRTLASGPYVDAFTAAATAYGSALSLQPTGPRAPLIVTCGEYFIGGLMPLSQNDETDRDYADLRSTWWDRLNDIQASHPRSPEQKVSNDAELTAVLLGGINDQPVKGKKAAANVEDEEPAAERGEDQDDDVPAEVESAPMFEEPPAPTPDDEAFGYAVAAVRYFDRIGARFTSVEELKAGLAVGHARAAAAVADLIAAGLIEGGKLNRAREVYVGLSFTADEAISRLRLQFGGRS